MEGSANIALPFSMPQRGVFAHRYCNTDFGLCPARSWTSSKPRPTECRRTEVTPHPPLTREPPKLGKLVSGNPATVPLVSLRLGHARALTPPRGVIHSPRAASLPTGEGFGLCVALICTPPHKRVAHFSNLLPLAENSVAFSSGRRCHPKGDG